MAGGIVYLDADDEITSAAARIRDVSGRRVALVLPYGSRVATSRINFRLLSRDALINEKQLAVVAADSGTRALAASAGLPVFGSVGEYESSLADAGEDRTAAPPPAVTPSAAPRAGATTRARRGSKAKAVAGSDAGADAGETATPTDETPATNPAGKATAAGGAAAGAGAHGAAAAATAATGGAAGATGSATRATPTPARHPIDGRAAPGRAPSTPPGDQTVLFADTGAPTRPAIDERPWAEPRPVSGAPAGHLRQTRPGTRPTPRMPFVIVLAALALVLLVGGVGAYVMLPSATIVVTPQAEALGRLNVTVTADPAATQPDAATLVVPATIFSFEVTANDTFPATGARVEETAAKGVVRFSNLDFLRTNTIPSGSIVSTNAGVRFKTAATITVPRADLVGLTVFPGRRNVTVTAVDPGTAGNVEPNTIVVVPQGEDPQALKVVNPDAASGGTHEEFPKVAQKDVDAAMEQLTAALDAAFKGRLADPSIAPEGVTVFAETGVLAEATPSVDPGTLVDQEIEAFDLGLTATGRVVTVNPAPVAEIADELLRAAVEPGHELVADSIQVTVGEPVVAGQTVRFSATATGQQVAILDAAALRTLVLGKPLDDAREILAPYGDVALTAWPEWVASVPTLADRVEVRIDQAVPVETPAPSGAMS
jgi:hypothetical protein